jgi:hypothetical protein
MLNSSKQLKKAKMEMAQSNVLHLQIQTSFDFSKGTVNEKNSASHSPIRRTIHIDKGQRRI